MPIVINVKGVDINKQEYDFIYVELLSKIELHYDRVSINTKCYKGVNIDNGNYEYSDEIIPKNWDRFFCIKIPYEQEANSNLIEWSNQKVIDELTNDKIIPYEYMMYENDIYELDEETGEPKIDEETGKEIIIHKKGDLIRKSNGAYKLYNKTVNAFCDIDDIKII